MDSYVLDETGLVTVAKTHRHNGIEFYGECGVVELNQDQWHNLYNVLRSWIAEEQITTYIH